MRGGTNSRQAAARRAERLKRRKQKMRRWMYLFAGTALLTACMISQGKGLGKTLAERHRPGTGAPDTVAAFYEEMDTGGPAAGGELPEELPVVNVDDTERLLQDEELEKALALLAKEDETAAAIYADRQLYPEELLAAFLGNPEMADFVMGYPAAEKKAVGGFTQEEAEEEFPLFLQWDSRWGYAPYGESNIGIAGCAPTCLSMVIFSLTKNMEATPDKLGEYSMRNGHYVEGIGTAWTLFDAAGAEYGLTVRELGLDEEEIKNCLDGGGMVILSMRPGDFTTSGHFIVVRGYDAAGFYVNDPNSMERSGMQWSYEKLKYQIKNIWGFYS